MGSPGGEGCIVMVGADLGDSETVWIEVGIDDVDVQVISVKSDGSEGVGWFGGQGGRSVPAYAVWK